MQTNTVLEVLEVNGNVIDLDGITAIAEALAVNTSLRVLRVRCGGVGRRILGVGGCGVCTARAAGEGVQEGWVGDGNQSRGGAGHGIGSHTGDSSPWVCCASHPRSLLPLHHHHHRHTEKEQM